MAQPPEKPIFRLFGAMRDVIGAAKETGAAIDAGKCIVCNERDHLPDSRFCEQCSDDAAEGAARLAEPMVQRVAGNVVDAFADRVRDALRGGRR